MEIVKPEPPALDAYLQEEDARKLSRRLPENNERVLVNHLGQMYWMKRSGSQFRLKLCVVQVPSLNGARSFTTDGRSRGHRVPKK